MSKKMLNENYDVVVVGAGPAGLSFACSMANTDLKVLVVERSSLKLISEPKPDGREIALTHNSLKILKKKIFSKRTSQNNSLARFETSIIIMTF